MRGQTSPREHLDGEEVDSCQNRHVRSDEVLPCCVLAAFGCGRQAMTPKNIAYGLIRNNVTEVGQAPTIRS